MEGIKIVGWLVQCAQSLLICGDLDTARWTFADMEECTRQLPAIISAAQHEAGPALVVMGRCRFQLGKTPSQADLATRHQGF